MSPNACWTTAIIHPQFISRIIVNEAIMIEPTETETKATLDGFIKAAMEKIADEAAARRRNWYTLPRTTRWYADWTKLWPPRKPVVRWAAPEK
jgi:glycine dehydrogenase subunit 2